MSQFVCIALTCLPKTVEYFHVFPTSYLRRLKGPAVPERDMQKMDQVKIALRHGLSNIRGRM